ncbi:hypothetical protein CHS0354_009676 [Potamilus streckersoni]|uniref:Uncharacterized protein n=1 Tax=Potamilus streckersoni TaxID=2493646 RepID=A0AAE0SN01_9BIVA|nr:hypothetical protein CHS0354_009676 [Potamilus streckersoni]
MMEKHHVLITVKVKVQSLMSNAEVFRPSNGAELLTRSALGEGYAPSMDMFRKTSRPSTQSGYRFGQLSHNSFFTRHNPHPSRVRHIKGR